MTWKIIAIETVVFSLRCVLLAAAIIVFAGIEWMIGRWAAHLLGLI